PPRPWEAVGGRTQSVASSCVRLLSNPECGQLRLERAPIDYFRRSRFISHYVVRRLLPCHPCACFLLCVALSEGGCSDVGLLHPLRVRRVLGIVVVVPVPPLVRRALGVTLWRVLPSLLTAERCDIEIAPDGPHRLVA